MPEVPNVKFDGFCAESREVFEHLVCFGIGVNFCQIDINQSATPKNLYLVDIRRHKRD